MWQITTSDPVLGDAEFLSLKHSAREWGPGRLCWFLSEGIMPLRQVLAVTVSHGFGIPALLSFKAKSSVRWKTPNI